MNLSPPDLKCNSPHHTPPQHQENQTAPPDEPTPADLLAALYGTAGDLLVELRGIRADGKIWRQWFETNLSGYTELLITADVWNAKGFNIYFGVHPRNSRGGSAEHVADYRAVFVDLDAGPGKDFPDADFALDMLECAVERMDVAPPSAVTLSGNGVHAYWLLKQPLPVEQTLRYKGIMRALADTLNADQAVGAGDPPRVMRLPGFENVKDPDDPKETSIELLQPELRFPVEYFPFAGVRSASNDYAGSVELPTEISGKLRQVCEALDDAGHRYRITETLDKRITAVVLNGPCPVCHGGPEKYVTPKEGTARITAVSLKLKCFREGCGAAVHTGGLPPAAWMPLMGLELPDAPPAIPTINLDDIPQHFQTAFNYAAQLWGEGRAGIVATSPGAGKTYLSFGPLAATVDAGRGAVLAVPNNSLVSEKAGELREHFPGLPVVEAVSMAKGCKQFKNLRQWQRYYKNLPAHACERGCNYREGCPAFTWREQYRAYKGRCVLVCTHHLLDKLPGPPPNLIVVDEFPAMIANHRTWTTADVDNVANPRRLATTTPWFYERRAAAKLLSRVLSYCTENRLSLLEKYSPRTSAKGDYGVALCSESLRDIVGRVASEIGAPVEQAFEYGRCGDLPFPITADLAAETPEYQNYAPVDFDNLVDNFTDCAVWLPGNRDKGELSEAHYRLLTHQTIDTPEGVPVVFMDATGAQTAPMLESAIGRHVDVLERELPTNYVNTTWIRTDTYTARRITHDENRVRRAAHLDLVEVVRDAGPEARYGVIATKAFKRDVWRAGLAGEVKTECGDFDCQPPLHYGATVGTNQLEAVDTLVLFGAPTPHIGVTDYEAWRYGMAGDDYRTRLERAELTQAIGRARGVRRTAENPLSIFVIGHHPPPGKDYTVKVRRPGRRRDSVSAALVEVFDNLVDTYGFIAPTMLTGTGALSRTATTLRQNWQLQDCLICQKRRDPLDTGAVLPQAMRSRVERLMREYMRQRGLASLRVANPEGTASVVVYEAVAGAYQCWVDTAGREELQRGAIPMPMVAVDVRLLEDLPDETAESLDVDGPLLLRVEPG